MRVWSWPLCPPGRGLLSAAQAALCRAPPNSGELLRAAGCAGLSLLVRTWPGCTSQVTAAAGCPSASSTKGGEGRAGFAATALWASALVACRSRRACGGIWCSVKVSVTGRSQRLHVWGQSHGIWSFKCRYSGHSVFPRVSAAAVAPAAAGLLMAPVHLSAPWGRGKTRFVLCPLTGTAGDVPLLVLHVVPGLVTLLKLFGCLHWPGICVFCLFLFYFYFLLFL